MKHQGRRLYWVISALTSSLFTSIIYANEAAPARGYKTENGIDIMPKLYLAAGYNSNLSFDNNNQIATPVVIARPELGARFHTERGKYFVAYQLKSFSATQSSNDDYLDQTIKGNAEWGFNLREKLQLSGQWQLGHEPRGTGLTQGITNAIPEPLKYTAYKVDARYVYGSRGAVGKLVGNIGVEQKDYQNTTFIRGNITDNSKYYDWMQPYLSGGFYLAVSKSFYSVLTLKYDSRRYDYLDRISGISRDNNNLFAYIGTEWEISGKTTGSILLGLQNKDFTAPEKIDFTGFSWKADVNWRLTEYSNMTLTSSSLARDPDQQGDYVKDSYIKLGWEHNWVSYILTDIHAKYAKTNLPSANRNDNRWDLGLSIGYKVANWCSLKFDVSSINQSSTLSSFTYNQIQTFISTEITL